MRSIHPLRVLRLIVLALGLLPSALWAWTTGLKEAAMAVAQGKGTAADEMMIFVHNHELNLMAQEGLLGDFSYAGAQGRFQEIQQKILNDTFKNTPYRAEVSKAKFNPGTDTDVNVFRADGKPMTLDDIRAVESNYQRAVRAHFDGQDLPQGRIDTKTDFMPHPAHTSPEEFKKIAQHINANGGSAYTDPLAASAQAKLGSPAKLSLNEAGAFQKQMQTLAEGRMAAAAELRKKAASIGTSNPGEYAKLQAQASQYEYQAAKYHERMSALNNHLRNQFGLGPEKGVMDDVAKKIAQIGRNSYSAGDLRLVRDLHGKALQNSSEQLINTLLDVAKKEPATLKQVKELVNAEVRALHAAGAPKAAAQAAIRMEQMAKRVEAAAKWAAYKETAKNLVTKIPVMAIADGAILGYQGVQISLTDVKATDTVWDFIRNCYYHAAWEGTGIGTAFERAQREEIERYLKEFDAGRDPSMATHITFTLLKTGVYLGEDMIIGVLTLPGTIWEAFTQEKEMEAYAAMQNDLARVMRQMINDRRAFEDLMTRMRKLGLHDEDMKYFLDCMCRSCGGSLGGLYNPSFKSEIGHGPCQCNGPLTIWKTPLPVGDTKTEYACFNAVTKMRYDQAQEIFNKWHQKAVEENAKSVAEEFNAIKGALDTSRLEKDPELVNQLADRAAAIAPLLLPQDLDYLQAILDPFLARHAEIAVEAGELDRALGCYDRIMNRLGTRNASERSVFERRQGEIKEWKRAWAEVKEKQFPEIDKLLKNHDVNAAGGMLEALEYRMTKEIPRRLPFATKDPEFLALKNRVADARKAYDEAVQRAYARARVAREDRNQRDAISAIESVLNEWRHRPDTQQGLVRQLEYHRNELGRAQRFAEDGAALEKDGAVTEAMEFYRKSLEIQRDDRLAQHLRELEATLEQQRQKKAQAKQLRDQAHAQQQQGRIAEAIGLYKQSLAIWPDKELEAFVAQLERGLADQQARKDQARQLRDQAHALQQQGRISEAIGLYKQSLAVWPDKELEAFVAQLERGLAQARAAATPTRPPVPAPTPGREPVSQVISNGNIDAVYNGPTRPSTFTIHEPRVLVLLQTYHWNNGRGAPPGTLGLRDAAGHSFGPWPASGSPGQGGVANAYWNVRPGVLLPAGEYTVVDSDPLTWSQNAASQGAGFFRIETAPAGQAATATPTPVPASTPPAARTADLRAGLVGRWRGEFFENGERTDESEISFAADGSFVTSGSTSIERLEGVRCTVRGEWRVDGDRLTIRPTSTVCRMPDGSTRNEHIDLDTTTGRLTREGTGWRYQIQNEPITVRFTPLGGAASAAPAAPLTTTAAPAQAAPSGVIRAELYNASSQPVHIIVQGEQAGPANRLEPGQRTSRNVPVRQDWAIPFIAIRDGQTVGTRIWRASPGDPSRTPVVVFDERNPFEKLTVTTGLR